jgi:hypothetical protein
MNEILKNNSKWLKPKLGSTFKICDASHGIESQLKKQTRKNNNEKF